MDNSETDPPDKPKRVHVNKYARGHSGLFIGLLNRINNSSCDQELLTKMIDTAADRGQIRPDERIKLLQIVENKFRVEKAAEEAEPTASAGKDDQKDGWRRNHSTHHNGSEITVRPPMSSRNIRGTGPLGSGDFHHRRNHRHHEVHLQRR